MALKVEMVTFDCTDPFELAAWWAEQFDGETRELMPGEFVAVVRAEGPTLGFQRVPDPTPGKTRVHLDFTAADVDAEVAPSRRRRREGDRQALVRGELPLGGARRPGGKRVLRGDRAADL